jgi:hypothetical protein
MPEACIALAGLRLLEVLMLFGVTWYLVWTVPPAPQRNVRLWLCSALIIINITAITIRVLVLQMPPW